jgi:hypothetical protein
MRLERSSRSLDSLQFRARTSRRNSNSPLASKLLRSLRSSQRSCDGSAARPTLRGIWRSPFQRKRWVPDQNGEARLISGCGGLDARTARPHRSARPIRTISDSNVLPWRASQSERSLLAIVTGAGFADSQSCDAQPPSRKSYF